ncbi:hypothetical protein RHSIM_Rhsim01G0153500 [Rhododendron simsii]|uniref:HMG box domain-containing protein n=1 Tax=Rhododendron simsii TaxID=118357 RepID=A0A834HKM0_RHOSS|nr:hypothetical protein RHSIM_Rhsim01G0153500 [Rhododendron simsii]
MPHRHHHTRDGATTRRTQRPSAIVTNSTRMKRDIGAQWKSLSNEERQKYKYLAEAAKEELVKQKELFSKELKKVKRKLQNRISLRSIVRIVKKLNAEQRNAVHAIGLGGILQLRCKFMNHELCNWLVGKFDPICRSLTVHGRTFVLTEAHVEECLGINAQSTVIDLEGNTDVAEMANQNWAKLTLQFLCKGVQDQRDKDHVQSSGCLFLLVVFYLERVSPTLKPSIRKFPSLVVWGDVEIKKVLHQFDKIGGYDREGVVVHFTQVGEPSGNMSGVSQISTADVQTMTSTFVNVAGFLLRQNMIMAKLLGYQSSPPIVFETPDLAMNESNGLSTNPSLHRDIGFEMPSRSQLEGEMAQQIDVEPVHPSARSSPQGFTSLAGLSRGRKRKLQNGNPVLSIRGYDNVEVHYEPPRLRQLDQLKKSHFHRSPFTEDVPWTVSSKKALHFLGVHPLNPQTLPYTEEMADDARKPTYEPLTDLEKLFTEFIFDIRDPSNGYDCGLFVIKFMQGFNYPSGVRRMDDTERPRLLMELCGDENNQDALEVMTKFEAWKAERGQCMPNTDRMSYVELRDVINETEYSNLVRVFYQVTASNGEIRLILIDGDVGLAEMFDLYGQGAEIDIYLDDLLWKDGSDSYSQRERGIQNISALSTTGQRSDSEINNYKDKPYEELKQGKYKIKNRDGSLRCPFCPGKKKQQFKYRDLVQHASRVGSGAVWRKPKLEAQHLALAVYLTSDLAHEAKGDQMSCSSTNHRGDDGDNPFGLVYDPTTPNCDCGMWANLRIAGLNSKHPGSLNFSCSKRKERCSFFRWCLPISGNVEVSTIDGTHVAVLDTKVQMLEEHARVMRTINRGLVWCLLAAIVVIFLNIMID